MFPVVNLRGQNEQIALHWVSGSLKYIIDDILFSISSLQDCEDCKKQLITEHPAIPNINTRESHNTVQFIIAAYTQSSGLLLTQIYGEEKTCIYINSDANVHVHVHFWTFARQDNDCSVIKLVYKCLHVCMDAGSSHYRFGFSLSYCISVIFAINNVTNTDICSNKRAQRERGSS